ncbi:B3 domain-containing protein REM20 [Bienertia sinuspersici]
MCKLQREKTKLEKAENKQWKKGRRWKGSSNNQMKAKDGEDAVQGAGLDELHVDQCVGDSNTEIRLSSGSGYNMCDNGTQREDVTEMTNGDGVVTLRVGSVYSSWEEVERMFKVYGKKKGFGVIRGHSVYYGGTKKKRAMTMRCECYRIEHFTASMRSRVLKDIDARVPLANIHAFESCGCERTCDIVMNGLKRISDEVRSYSVAHVDEGGGMRGVGDIDSVHSSEPISSTTQRTAVSRTLHGEQTQAPAPPIDNLSANVAGQSDGSKPSFRIDIVSDSGPGEHVATVVCGDPPLPKKKGRPKVTCYKSPGEKDWKKANENGSKNGGSGGKRKYHICEVQYSDGDIAHMMAVAFEKMKVTKNTNLSGNLAEAHAEQNVQHTVLQFGVEEDNLLSRNCISWEAYLWSSLTAVTMPDLPRDFQFTHSCATTDTLVIPDPIVCRSHQDIHEVVALRRYGTPMVWHVTLHRIQTEHGMEFELVKGWADFIRDNHVVNSDEVFFEYIGNSVFTVIVRDAHGVFKEVQLRHEVHSGQRLRRPRPYWNGHQDNCFAIQVYLDNSQYPGFLVYMNRRYISTGIVNIPNQWVRANVPHDMMSGDCTVSLTYRG